MTAVGLSARAVFSLKFNIALAVGLAIVFWILFNFLDGLLFFSPYLDFYYPLPQGAILGFILSSMTAPLIGVVMSMNIYVARNSGFIGKSFLSGSSLGAVSSVCASCSSVGFYLATTFGAAGVAASAFMSNFQLPLRLIAIGLLIWAYYSAHRKIIGSCMPKYERD